MSNRNEPSRPRNQNLKTEGGRKPVNIPQLEPVDKVNPNVDYNSSRTDFWNASFWYQNPVGRTLTAKNKTGQMLQIILETALTFTPFKKLSEVTGHVTTISEATKCRKSLAQLNLEDSTIMRIKYGVIAVLVILLLTKVIDAGTVSEIIDLLRMVGFAA